VNAKIIKSDPPETTEILAASVIKISEAMDKLLNAPGGLRREAIVLLIHDMTKVGKPDIRLVLDALPQLRGYWCRKP
jgi:hypothetical protein